jgi:hypothetical protein
MQHLVGYYQNVDQGAVLTAINAAPDSILYVVGTTVRVPAELAFAAGVTMLTAQTTQTEVQLRTPTLRELFYPSYSPWVAALQLTSTSNCVIFNPGNPLPLTGLEQMEVWTNTDGAAAADIYGMVWLQDGPVQPVTGEMFTIRATAASALSVGTWVNSQLTFNQALPVGDYQVVGMKATGTGLVAARLVFQGYAWRPGVLGSLFGGSIDMPNSRYGAAGVMGTFNNNVPPTVDCMGATGTSQAILLDLIKIG